MTNADKIERLRARLAETQQCLEDTCGQLAIEAQRVAEAERLLRQALDADKYDWNMGLTDRIEEFLKNN